MALDLSRYEQRPLTQDDLKELVHQVIATSADVTLSLLHFLRSTEVTDIAAWLEQFCSDDDRVLQFSARALLAKWNGLASRKYHGRPLTREGIRGLVSEMYSTIDANVAILHFLQASNDHQVATWLGELCNDEDPELRCNAAEMLVWLNPVAAFPWVSGLLSSGDLHVRGAGCDLLARIGTQEAATLLVAIAQNDTSDCVRYHAVDGLEVIGGPPAVSVLLRIAETDTGGDYEGRPIQDKAVKAIAAIQRRHPQ